MFLAGMLCAWHLGQTFACSSFPSLQENEPISNHKYHPLGRRHHLPCRFHRLDHRLDTNRSKGRPNNPCSECMRSNSLLRKTLLTMLHTFAISGLLGRLPCTCCLQRTSHTYCLDCRHCSLGSLHMGLCYLPSYYRHLDFAADNPLVSCPWDHQLPVLISEYSKTAMPSFHCQMGTTSAVYWSL